MNKFTSKPTENYQNKRVRDLSELLNRGDLGSRDRARVIMALQKEYGVIAQDELEKQVLVEKSKVEGKAEGRAAGKAEGQAEGRATIITQMYRNGMSTSQIARITNDTVEAIENIINGAIHE